MPEPPPTPIHARKMHHWPGITTVARRLSRSVRTVNQMVIDGDIKAYKTANGDRRFDPEEIQSLLDDLKEVPEDIEDDAGTITAKAKGESVVLNAALALVKEQRDQNREWHQANLDLHKELRASYKSSTESHTQTIQFLTTRVHDLEQTQIEYLLAREELLDAREDREIIRTRAKARNEITADIWATTKQNFGALIEAARERFLIDPKTMTKLKAASELLQSIAATPVRLEAIVETGLVDEKEAALIRTILDMGEPANKKPDDDETPAEASSSDAVADETRGAPTPETPADETTPASTVIDVEPEPQTTANQATENGDQTS